MSQEPSWETHELTVVWRPERQYAATPKAGPVRRAFFTCNGIDAGVLTTDDVESLHFVGAGGEAGLLVKANALILQFAELSYPAKTSFNLVRGLLELEDGVSSTLVHGQLPQRPDERG